MVYKMGIFLTVEGKKAGNRLLDTRFIRWITVNITQKSLPKKHNPSNNIQTKTLKTLII